MNEDYRKPDDKGLTEHESQPLSDDELTTLADETLLELDCREMAASMLAESRPPTSKLRQP